MHYLRVYAGMLIAFIPLLELGYAAILQDHGMCNHDVSWLQYPCVSNYIRISMMYIVTHTLAILIQG